MKNNYVGIMVANPKLRKHVLRKYLQHNTTNLKLFCFTPSSINWKKKSVIGLYRSNRRWVLSKLSFPQVIYNRCYHTDQALIQRLETEIGSNKCFNHINQLNKHEIYSRLSKWLVDYLPDTVLYNQENAVQFLEVYKVIYFKPCCGHKGKGVYRVELMESGEIHIGLHYFAPDVIVGDVEQYHKNIQELIGSTPYIIQKGVELGQLNKQNFDIRALVQKNESGLWSVTNLVSRIAYTGSYNTSICEKTCLSLEVLHQLYPPEKVYAIIGTIYNISLRTAEIIETETSYHLGEFSVDFALDNDEQVWIIELNGKPQKDLYEGLDKQDEVYMRPIQYARFLYTI
ncbi:YheC/YheD family protein [Paenibacillus sp. 481]|uniref:YheC/YheD family protein n=1 Tax=Paenibacillus sp. 481 TaxID=2835869 RepID=UPI001E51E201|nr:YheC/YheD family protein [Paenibacillus sp. 481]UHA73808.1 YheC/YheD family protein [Paenibacillus sp. 481]